MNRLLRIETNLRRHEARECFEQYIPIRVGYPFHVTEMRDRYHRDKQEMWAWCESQCGGSSAITVDYRKERWYFETDATWGQLSEDFWFRDANVALAFKMRWC